MANAKPARMPVVRCIVSVTVSDGTRHWVTVHASTLFEAATPGIVAFRAEKWAAGALTPNATLRIEAQPAPVVHDVTIKALERWISAPSISPSEQAAKRA